MKRALFLFTCVVTFTMLCSCDDKEEEVAEFDFSAYDEQYYAQRASISSDDPAFSVTGNGYTVNFTANGGEVVVDVACGTEWAATADAPWISVGVGTGSVLISVGANTEETAKSGLVTLASAASGIVFGTVSVVEAAYGAPELNLETAEWNAPGVGILTIEIGVEATAEWEVESVSEPWLSAWKSGDGAVTVTVERNAEPESRAAEVSLSCSDGVNAVKKTIKVNQDGEAFITLSSDIFVSDGNGESAEITVASNFSWDYIYDPTANWFSVERDGDALIVTITADNSTGIDFEDSVTVVAGDGAYNSATAKVTVRETSADVSSMILEYSIPSAGTELTLPLYSSSTKCDVDWGDGSTEYVSEKYPTHTYAEAGTYTVTLSGTVPALSHQATAIRNSGSPALLTKVVQWGQTGLNDLNYAFYNCTNLVSLPTVTGTSLQAVASLSDAFEGCSSLEAIPDDLFALCTSTTISNLGYLFYNCSSIKVVPEGLFDAMTGVTAVNYVFSGCSSLEEIPSSLFDNCKKITNFSYTFRNCTSLVSEVPYTVLDNGDKVYLYDRADHTDVFTAPTSTTSCFAGCTNMQGYDDIPSGWK